MLSIWIGIIGNIDKASTKIVDMSSLLSQLRQAAAWGRAINIELHAQFPMPAPSSTSSLNTRRRRRKKIFSMQAFHSLPNMVLMVMTQISDTLSLGH